MRRGVPMIRILVHAVAHIILPALGLTFVSHPPCIAAGPEQPRLTFHRLSTKDGMLSNAVRGLALDSKGFLWIGTWNGLDRYDGYTYASYRYNAGEEGGLPAAPINAIYEDRDGILWLGADEGILIRFDRGRQSFQTFTITADSGRTGSMASFHTITQDIAGRLWLVDTDGRAFIFNAATGAATRACNGSRPLSRITAVYVDRNNDVWLTDYHGLYRRSGDDATWTYSRRNDTLHKDGVSPIRLRALLEDKTGRFFVGCNDGLFLFDRQKRVFSRVDGRAVGFDRRFLNVNSLALDSAGSVWITTPIGLARYDGNAFRMHGFIDGGLEGSSFSTYPKVVIDRAGLLWSTLSNGIGKVNPGQAFGRYKTPQAGPLEIGKLRAIFKDVDGAMWIGADKGLYRIAPNTQEWRLQPHLAPLDAPNASVNAVFRDRLGYLWVAPTAGVVVCAPPDGGTPIRYKMNQADSTAIPAGAYTFFEDTSGELWLGCRGGLLRFNRAENNFRRCIPGFPLTEFVFNVCEDSSGAIWAASSVGLYRIDPDSRGVMDHFLHSVADSTGPSGNDFWTVITDRRGVVWAGVYGGGFSRFNAADKSFTRYGQAQGLASDGVYGILEAPGGTLWISTDKGLSRFDPETETFDRFDKSDGLITNQNYFGAYHADRLTGTFYVGGEDGFSPFIPDNLDAIRRAPPPLVLALRVFDTLAYRELYHGDTATLATADNFLEFECSALDFTSPANYRYAFRLEGVETTWPRASYKRTVVYADLAPGEYRLRARAFGRNGEWQSADAEIIVQIAAPWWSAWTVRAAGLTLFAVLVLAAFRGRRRRSELQRKALELEIRALRLQMNPHFIFNSLVSIQHFLLSSDARAAHDHVARFARLMRMVLDNSRCELISLERELDTLRTYLDLEMLRGRDAFRYIIDVDSELDCSRAQVPPLALQPYAENAIKHAFSPRRRDGELRLTIRREGDLLRFSIEDNGAGLRAARSGDRGGIGGSVGMTATRERLESLGKKLQRPFSVRVFNRASAEGETRGARVEITMPFIEKTPGEGPTANGTVRAPKS